MWKLPKSSDIYDEIFNGLIRRVLRGKGLEFERWERAWDKLAQEVDKEASEAAKQEASEARSSFLQIMEKYQLPLDNRIQMCYRMEKLAKEQSSSELLRLLCHVECDLGMLLNIDRDDDAAESDALYWPELKRSVESLFIHLTERQKMSIRFQHVLKRLKKVKASERTDEHDCQEQQKAVLSAYTKYFGSGSNPEALSENFYWLIETAQQNQVLQTVMPLFLFQAVRKHQKRLESDISFSIDYSRLWTYQAYQIDHNNDKNYKRYARFLAFFEALYEIYKSDEKVDMVLCLYGFDVLSNLGDYYRMYPDDQQRLPLMTSVEDILLHHECAFTCYEHGFYDNVIAAECKISYDKLERFSYSNKPQNVEIRNHIEGYINQNYKQFMERFIEAKPQEVRPLLEEILDGAQLPEEIAPNNEKKKNLVLAAINDALMEAVDDLADQCLTSACHELIGDNALKRKEAAK